MSSPGGDEVGRVSVRVVPDTGKFADELRRDLRKLENELKVTIPVDFDVDTAGLRAQIEAIRVPTIEIPVEYDLPNTPPPVVPVDADTDPAEREVDGFVRDTERRRPTVQVGADARSIRDDIARAVELADLKAKVDLDQEHFEAQLTRAVGSIGRLQRIKVPVDVDRRPLRVALADIGNSITSVLGKIGGLGGAALSGITAGISEARDAFSSAAGPIGAVVSAGLQLGVVAALAVGVAEAGAGITAAWATVSTAIAAVPAAIALIGVPIAAVTVGMDGIKKAAQTLKPAFDQLKASVSATFEAGLLPVFERLKGIFPTLTIGLNGVATALVGLASKVVGLITSAQGIAAISLLFTNVAAAIASIDLVPLVSGFLQLASNQAALAALVGTINELGLSLQSIANNPALDQAFAGLEGVLRSLLAAFTALINNGIKAFAAAAPGIKAALDGITEFFGKFDYAALGAAVGQAFRGIGDALKSIPPGTIQAIQAAFQKLGEVLSGPNFQGAIQNVVAMLPGLITGLSEFIDGAADIINKISAIGAAIGAAASGEFSQAATLIKGAFSDVTPTVEAQLSGVQGAVTNNLAPVPGQVTSSLAPVPGAVGQGLAAAGPAAQQGIAAVPQGVQVGLQPIPGLVNAAFVAIGPQINQAMAGLATYVSFGMVGLGQAVTAGIATNMVPAFTAGLAALSPVVTAAFAGLSVSVGIGMGLLADGVTQGFVAVGGAFTNGFIALSPVVAQSFAGLTVAMAAGMVTLAAAVTTGFTGVNLAFTNGFLALGPLITQSFAAGLSVTMAAGMTILATAVTTGFVAVNAAFAAGFVGVAPIVTQGFAGLGTAATAGMDAITASVTQGFVSINAAVTAGGDALVASFQAKLAEAVAAMADGVTQIAAAADGLPPAMTTVGNNMMAALAAAIAAGRSAVINAVAQVVAAAVAAANSALAIHSPSRVFQQIGAAIPAGAAKGVDDNASLFVDSVKAMADAGARAGAGLGDAFTLPDWDGGIGKLHGRVARQLSVATAQAPASSQPGPVFHIQAGQDVNTVELADLVMFKLRHFQRRGVHAY